jgi:ADP-ribose pyrophosphatase YjhB (NUDIX family)
VTFVNVIVKRGDLTLTEVAQLLATGETRERSWPPGEKLLPGEDVEVAAYRCVEEELGVSRESCRIVPDTHTTGERTGESPSYPGLVTRYRTNAIEMKVPGLPETKFSTPDTGDPTIKLHYWDWC